MQQLQGVSRLPPPILFGQEVLDVDLVTIRDIYAACSAWPLLGLQEPGDARRSLGMASSASAPVPPVSVLRTAGAWHFHRALVRCRVVASHASRPVGGWEAPALSIVSSPVVARHPRCRFVGMTGDGPSPQHRGDRVVEPLTNACAAHVGIRRPPANALRMEGFDPHLLLRVSLAVDRLSEGLDMPLRRCWAGGDTRCEAVETSSTLFPRRRLSHRAWSALHAETVETRSALCAVHSLGPPCCAWFHRSSSLMQPRRPHRLPALHDCTILLEDDEVLGRDPHGGRLESATPTAWKRLVQAGFKTVYGETGESR